MIERNLEVEQQIFNTYLHTIKMINFDYEIIVSTEKIEFNTIQTILEKNSYLTCNDKQKRLINNYKEYLNSFPAKSKIYKKKFYIVFKDIDNRKQREIEEMDKILNSIGIRIRKITEEGELFKLLYEMINEIRGELSYENREYISK